MFFVLMVLTNVGTVDAVTISNTQEDGVWINTSITSTPNVDLPDEIIEDDLTDYIFKNLNYNYAGLSKAIVIFQVENPFLIDIPIVIDYFVVDNEIVNVSYTLENSHWWIENIPKYIKSKECTTEGNGTWCWDVYTENGTQQINRTETYWQPMSIVSEMAQIPANYSGQLKVEMQYEYSAYEKMVRIDWMPKTRLDLGVFKFEKNFAQQKWAWLNISFDHKKEINVTCQQSEHDCLFEPVWKFLFNDTDINGSVLTNQTDILIASNESGAEVEIPSMYWNYSNFTSDSPHQTVLWFANSTSGIVPAHSYFIYYGNPLDTTYAYYPCSVWSPCHEDATNKSFFVLGITYEKDNPGIFSGPAWDEFNSNKSFQGDIRNGNTTFWLKSTAAGDQFLTYVFERNNASHLWFGMHMKMNVVSDFNFFQIADNGTPNSFNLQMTDGIDVVHGATAIEVGIGGTTEWAVFNGDLTTTLTNITYYQDEGGAFLNNTTADFILGIPSTYNNFSLVLAGSTTGNMNLDDLFISTQNEFRLYNNLSILSTGPELDVPLSGEVSINASFFDPPNLTEFSDGITHTFNLTVCNQSQAHASEVNLSIAGSSSVRILTNDSINSSCMNVFTTNTTLPPGNHVYRWDVLANTSRNTSESGVYTINLNASNIVDVIITPGTSVDVGTQTTATCTDTLGGVLSLTRDGFGVSNPEIIVLNAGTFNYSCESNFASNFTLANNSTILTVNPGSIGCSNNLTYAFSGDFVVTDNISVIDFLADRSNNTVRFDIQDIIVATSNATVVEINVSRYVVLNTTGSIGNATPVTVHYGNIFNNNSYTISSGVATATNSLTNNSTNDNHITVTIFEERNLTQQTPPAANKTFQLFCGEEGEARFDILETQNTTKFTAATFGQWDQLRVKVDYGAGVQYFRNLLIVSPVENRDLYLIDANEFQVAQVVNQLDDFTGLFGNATITVKKPIASQIRIMDQQFFDASSFAFFYGIVGDQYQYEISNGIQTRILGNIIVDLTDLDKKITLNIIDLGETEFLDQLEFRLGFDNTTGIISLRYIDPFNATQEVNFTVFNSSNDQVFFSQALNTTNATSDVLFQFAIANSSEKHRVFVQVDHEQMIGPISYTGFVAGIVGLFGFGAFSLLFRTLGAITVVLGIFLSVSRVNAPFGFIIGNLLLLYFAIEGIISISVGVVGFALALSIFWFFGREVHKP